MEGVSLVRGLMRRRSVVEETKIQMQRGLQSSARVLKTGTRLLFKRVRGGIFEPWLWWLYARDLQRVAAILRLVINLTNFFQVNDVHGQIS